MGDLARLQPAAALDLQALVSPEEVDGVVALPRGACSGELLPRPAAVDTRRGRVDAGGRGGQGSPTGSYASPTGGSPQGCTV